MEEMTMDTAAPVSAAVSETQENQEAKTSSLLAPAVKVGEFLRWIWWFDLGAVALAGGQTARLIKAVVEKGKEVEPSVIKPFKKAEDAVGGALSEVGSHLKVTAKPESPAENAPLLVEMRELSTKVDELARRVEGLHAQQSIGEEQEARAANAT